jgi:hypothetical protein
MHTTQPPTQWVPGALSLGLKLLGREADHSRPSSAEVKKCLELHLHSPIRLHGEMLSEAQRQLYLLCTMYILSYIMRKVFWNVLRLPSTMTRAWENTDYINTSVE